jgi:arginyl-tRNA synthetase
MDEQNPVISLTTSVEDAVRRAIATVLPDQLDADPLVRPSDHADVQANAALSLAKAVKRRPADLGADLAAALLSSAAYLPSAPTEAPLLADVTVSGPGFVNLTFSDAAIWAQVTARLAHPRLGVPTPELGRRTVIDYSAPNVAKEMHVGHLRTTIIGDALARVIGFLGGDVIRQNHLGDWGTQFGMLIQYLDEHPDATWHHDQLAAGTSAVSALDGLYRAARKVFDADPDFADRARARVVELQAGDMATVAAWKAIVAESQTAFNELYARLGVLLTDADSVGESFYNDQLADVAAELEADGVAVQSRGALCVFDESITGPDDLPIPLMVRKSDGGYGYDTTDLATIRYRIRDLKANRILYVVDARQALHFRLVFSAARAAGWLTDDVQAVHVPFGTVMGPDGRPFKTRSGDTVKLSDLLDAAVTAARTAVAEKNPDMPDTELDRIANQAGIGAIKYADLSNNRVKDYAFDPDRMVALTGNTGVYLQYAHARISSILARAASEDAAQGTTPGEVDTSLTLHAAERALVLALDAFSVTLTEVADSLEPHRLCGYLFALAKAYSDFHEACPVLRADTPAQRSNRLALCRLTAATLSQGLDLLGIAAPAKM